MSSSFKFIIQNGLDGNLNQHKKVSKITNYNIFKSIHKEFKKRRALLIKNNQIVHIQKVKSDFLWRRMK